MDFVGYGKKQDLSKKINLVKQLLNINLFVLSKLTPESYMILAYLRDLLEDILENINYAGDVFSNYENVEQLGISW
jgi:hypothetical protein